jgi:hypothetical protein
MKRVSVSALLCVLCVYGTADANTFFTGANQSPQRWYQASGPSPMSAGAQQNQFQHTNNNWNRPAAQQPGQQQRPTQQQQQWGQPPQQQRPGQQPQQQQRPGQQPQQASQASGFTLTGGLSHQYAMWGFDMNQARSSLHYDNIAWNVLDVNAGYQFNAGGMSLVLGGGIRYGMQSGETTMVDDDISNGGTMYNIFADESHQTLIGHAFGYAMSIGKSSGGTMFGYNLGLSLTDKFQIGSVRLNPGVGWRSLSYRLKTNKNHGLSMIVGEYWDGTDGNGNPGSWPNNIGAAGTNWWISCEQVPWSDEIQCIPLFVQGGLHGDTYFFSQPGVSHDYTVSWAGPFIALDFDYEINRNNSVNARIELGLPGYNAVGDQPYRPDWAHPKSVEDTAGIGSARHIGLGANWLTSVADNVMLSIGMTFDHYSVRGAQAQTFLNSGWWSELRSDTQNLWNFLNAGNTTLPGASEPLCGGANQQSCVELMAGLQDFIDYVNLLQGNGWTITDKNEINSIYRSMGIRIGLSAQF